MDDQELTPWQEISPAALAERPGQPCALSPTRDPASPTELQEELTACLALCGAAGMSEDDRCEWLRAARITLEGIPADLLRQGCQRARETCDHPSKIVPAILEDIRQQWNFRREHPPVTTPRLSGPRPPRGIGALMDARGKPMTEAEADILNRHLERIGSPSRYCPDGSKQKVAA